MTKRIIVFIFILSLSTICFSQRPRVDINGKHLLKTAWGGSEPFNAFAPHGSTLGCHSVAFAQAMHFHRLAPYGKVFYKCKDGTVISEEFSDYNPRWNTFALNKDSAKKNVSSTRQTSKFIYYIASIIRKDFGTDQYVDYPNDGHKKAIESHFHCTLTPYAKEIKLSIGHTLKADIVFVPHHGSVRTLDGNFLQRLAPDILIYSCDRKYEKQYNLVEQDNSIKSFYTSEHGAIVIRVNQDGLVSTKTFVR